MRPSLLHSFSILSIYQVHASVTVYTVKSAATGAPLAANPVTLSAPAIPNPAPTATFSVTPPSATDAAASGLSIPQKGSFMGFSIELGTSWSFLGENSSFIQPGFLNLMENIQTRAGGQVNIRIGGASQDTAVLVNSIPTSQGGQSEVDILGVGAYKPTVTTEFTTEYLNMLSHISKLVNAHWYLGIPFNDTKNFRLSIAEVGAQVLGNNLIGLQVGSQPDLYAVEGIRNYTYSPMDYVSEFGELVSALKQLGSNTTTTRIENLLIGPNVVNNEWTPEEVWDTGFVDTYSSNLGALGLEWYPETNCNFTGSAQDAFPWFLNHTSATSAVAPFLKSAQVAAAAGKPLVMMETNSASCGGIPGISDSFGAALWTVDYALQLAYGNFSGANFHNNGQNVYYNAITPPPSEQAGTAEWTVGPGYYAALAVTETLGSGGAAQVLDLNANGGNMYSPAYAIYEKGSVSRVGLFNYITDPSGKSDFTASVSAPGAKQVQVKYLQAASVGQKGNYTWAGQTFGSYFESDGTPKGTVQIQTVTCTDGICLVKVPAPSFALVFLNSDTIVGATNSPPTQTFATTVTMPQINTATLNPLVLATSNGRRRNGTLGSTSKGGKILESGATGQTVSCMLSLVPLMMAGMWLLYAP